MSAATWAVPVSTWAVPPQKRWSPAHASPIWQGVALTTAYTLAPFRSICRPCAHANKASSRARSDLESRIEATPGLDLLRGEAHFIASKTLEVYLKGGETHQITAPMIFIDTGDRPEQLTIKGVESVPVLNSTTIMELDTVPEHLLIIGGGYIGLEFGQMFRRFGSQVTLIQRSPRLLMIEDEDVSDAIAKILREDGITVNCMRPELRCSTCCGVVPVRTVIPSSRKIFAIASLTSSSSLISRRGLR